MKFQHPEYQKKNAKNMRNNPELPEVILWSYLKNKQLNGLKFRRQQPVGKYIVDFLCCSEKIIIELDGSQHCGNEDYDKIRDKYLQNEGYQVIRIWNNDIYNNIEGVMKYLEEKTETPSRKSEIAGQACNDKIKETNEIKLQCPAKINLTLKVLGKRPDGFHDIESVMQTISLYDYLTISANPAEKFSITLDGSSREIPYDERNLVHKAAMMFIERTNIPPHKIDIYIDKNIPVSAGLAGGSTDAAGTLYGLNKIFNEPLSKAELHSLCSKLGSDLNFCLEGGRQMTTGRGEILKPLEFKDFNVSLIKPENLGISAKEAYTKFSDKLNKGFKSDFGSRNDFQNDLEWALIDDYEELKTIKKLYPESVMSGSGSSYFSVNMEFAPLENYWIANNLKAAAKGICVLN